MALYNPFSSRHKETPSPSLPIPYERAVPATVMTGDKEKKISSLLRKASATLGLRDNYGSRLSLISYANAGFERPPYDFDRIIRAINTDSYVKQAFSKYRELIWKEGWEIVGENTRAIDYIWDRLSYMELTMGQPMEVFFKDVGDQLVKFHNCFIAKVRHQDFPQYFPGKLLPIDDRGPIIGYEIIPAETIRIKRDARNRPIKYIQEVPGATGSNISGEVIKQPQWDPKDIIHLSVDKMPGHIFGVPFMTAAIEDVVTLRALEEDVQNLVHQQLFPIIDVTVGTEERPGTDEEVEKAAFEIDDMSHDGALIHSERRKIEIIGSNGKALDAAPYLNHFKERVAIGLGIFPHHLGMSMNGGNRSMTDRLDVALYDRIKTYQKYLSEGFQLFIFSELLREGGFNPVFNPSKSGPSDRCTFRFREIDVDTQIKKENQVIQLYLNNLISLPEARLRLNLEADFTVEETMAAITTKIADKSTKGAASNDQKLAKDTATHQNDLQKQLATHQNKLAKDLATHQAKLKPEPSSTPMATTTVKTQSPTGASKTVTKQVPHGAHPDSGPKVSVGKKSTAAKKTVAKKVAAQKKVVDNKSRPANQHGKRTSPNVRHSDSWLDVGELLTELEEQDED